VRDKAGKFKDIQTYKRAHAGHAAQEQSRDGGGGEDVEVYAGLTRHTLHLNLKINVARATADRINS